MQRIERLSGKVGYEEAIRVAIDAAAAELWCALPGIIQGFDDTEGTVSVQPSIQAVLRNADGSTSNKTLPTLIHCPVCFQGGGGYTLTLPYQNGDECLVVFADRCIDAWWQQGGIQVQAELRLHDLSDGFALIGVRSKPRVLPGYSHASAQLRSDDGKTFIEVAGQNVNVTAPGQVAITAPLVTMSGDLAVQGDITWGPQKTSATSHEHVGVQSGGALTGAPQAGT